MMLAPTEKTDYQIHKVGMKAVIAPWQSQTLSNTA
jgi:hypothetical protein